MTSLPRCGLSLSVRAGVGERALDALALRKFEASVLKRLRV